MTWFEIILATLRDNEVRLVTYVPDNILTPLVNGAAADDYFVTVGATREDEAVATVAGAYMAGLRGAVLMQTSGFALIGNALASLVVPYQLPAILIVSERGTMGEFNIGQTLVTRTLRPTLDALDVVHHTLADAATLRFILDRSIKQAFMTQAPVALILSPLLTGGNPAASAQLLSREVPAREQRPGFGKDAQPRGADAAGGTARARGGGGRRHRQHKISTSSPPAIARRISTCTAAWGLPARSRSAWCWRNQAAG